MFSIVHTTWLNELRSRGVRRRASFDWDDDLIENLPDPSGQTPESALMHEQVIAAVERLPEAQRVVMLLVAVEGLSYQEAADVLEIPIGTVMSRLSRARQAIGARFAPRRAPSRAATTPGDTLA